MTMSHSSSLGIDGMALLLVDAAGKATILLVAAWAVARGMRRSSAASRHGVWTLALAGLIIAPILSSLAPGWRVKVPATASRPKTVAPPVAVAQARPIAPAAREAVRRPEAAPRVAEVRKRPAEAPKRKPREADRAVMPSPAAASPARSIAVAPAWRWPSAATLLVSAWIVGAIVAASPTALGVVAAEVRRRRSERACGEWMALTDAVREQLAIGRRVEVVRGTGAPIPMTWGVARPVVMIPEEGDAWPEATRRLVLLHELSHIRRLDAGTLLLGRLAASLYWFHPLAWLALRHLRDECERACDDCVMAAGERPSSYAQGLLDLARSLGRPRLSVAVAMARSTVLEGRVMAMFDASRSHAPLGRKGAGALVLGASALVLAVATFHPGAAPAQEAKAAAKPSGKGTITGTVVRDADKAPVAGAEVVLLDPVPKGQDAYYGDLPLHRTVADASGRFAFEGLAPGKYRVWANFEAMSSRKAHIGRGGPDVTVPGSGEGPGPVELRMKPAPTVRVKVTDKLTGKPIAGATVHPGWSDFPNDFTGGADGMVLVRPLTPERTMLEVWADGHAKETRWINLENGEDVDETFALPAGGDLEGVVRDPSGAPVADAGLSAFAVGDYKQLEYVKTDKAGRYRLRHLPRGMPLNISVSKKDYGNKESKVTVAGPSETLDFTLPPRPFGGSIAGVVRDGRGRPIAGAEVQNRGRSSSDVRETKTDEAGRFRLDDLYESVNGREVIVWAKGAIPKPVKVDLVGSRQKPAEFVIDMEPGHRIRGRVVDDKGRPVKGARVSFGRGRQPFGDGDQTETDDGGRFALDTLPPDATLSFWKGGFSEIQDRKLPIDGDAEVEVAMAPSAAILGKVVDAKTGRPIPSFLVQITFSPVRKATDPSSGLRSDLVNPGQKFRSAEGRFRIGDLVLGMPLQVMVSADGYERGVIGRVEAASGDEAAEFRLEPLDPKNLIAYQGRLLDDDGKPVAGAHVRLIATRDRPRGPAGRGFPFNWQMITSGQAAQAAQVLRFLEATTDKAGVFTFPSLPKDMEVEIVWWGTGVVPGRSEHLEAMDRKPTDIFEIRTPPSCTIIGTLNRKAYPSAGRLRLDDDQGAIEGVDIELKADQEEFTFPDLPPGTYRITLSTPFERVPGGGGSLTNRVLATKTVRVAAAGSDRADFD